MHFFHTTMYQSIKLILKPVKIFKTLRHVSISYEIILREFVVSLLRLLSFKSLSCDGFIVVMRQHTYGISALCALRSYLLIRVAFSRMVNVKSETSSRITNTHLEKSLRIATFQIKPDINRIARNKHYQIYH